MPKPKPVAQRIIAPNKDGSKRVYFLYQYKKVQKIDLNKFTIFQNRKELKEIVKCFIQNGKELPEIIIPEVEVPSLPVFQIPSPENQPIQDYVSFDNDPPQDFDQCFIDDQPDFPCSDDENVEYALF